MYQNTKADVPLSKEKGERALPTAKALPLEELLPPHSLTEKTQRDKVRVRAERCFSDTHGQRALLSVGL